jgi:hypothetical protein
MESSFTSLLAPGGPAATAALASRIKGAISLAKVTSGKTRQRLFALSKHQLHWFARTQPGRITVLRGVQRLDGRWIAHLVGFGIGHVTMLLESRDDLGPEFSGRERLYTQRGASARA